jgi:hypothetical protein
MKNPYLIFCLLIVLTSCSDGYQVKDFDKGQWKRDKKGCSGKRIELVKILLNNKARFKGLDDDDLLDLLGKPEKTVYYGRGRKDYSYYVTPGGQCEDKADTKPGSRLLVEFDALGYVNIITLQDI